MIKAVSIRGVLKFLKWIIVLVAVVVTVTLVYVGPEKILGQTNKNRALQVVKPVPREPVAQQPLSLQPDFFVEYRLERDRIRSEQLDLLREIVKNSKQDDKTREKAQEGILRLSLDRQKELEMENLIKARGFADALVFIREGSVNAIIKVEHLSRDEVLQIADIIGKSTGTKPENITISSKP